MTCRARKPLTLGGDTLSEHVENWIGIVRMQALLT